MYQKYPTNMINYVDSKGNVVTDAIIRSIQVRSEDDIENNVIKNPTPGDRAYLPDESKAWIFGADGEWHQKTTSGSGSGGSSGGGGGSGITVIECEFVSDEENNSYTLTNADLIAAALTDIEQNPTHLWNYGLYVHSTRGDMAGNVIIAGYTANGEPVYGFYGLRTTEGLLVIVRETFVEGGKTITEYYFGDSFYFSPDDIDKNGTATMTPNPPDDDSSGGDSSGDTGRGGTNPK